MLNKTSVLVLTGFIGFAAVGNVVAEQVIYSQDFSDNPNFTSLASDYAYWDSSQGNYYVKTRDNLQHKYWGYSPNIGTIDPATDNYTIKFDLMIEKQNWGTYPTVRFYSEEPTELANSSRVFYFSNGNYSTEGGRERFDICAFGSSPKTCLYTPKWSVKNNMWYSVQIVTKSNGTKVDLIVKERQTGQALGIFTDVNFPLSKFNYIGIGFYDQPNYGTDYAPMRIDNIHITAEKGISHTPLSVDIAAFSGKSDAQSTVLTWTALSEHLGFNIYRAELQDGKYANVTKLNNDLYSSQGESDEYTFIDDTAVAGKTYYYGLESFDFAGEITQHTDDIISITAE